MGRRRRSDPVGGIHHVMNRGVDRQPVFFDDRDRIEFGRRLAEIHDRFDVRVLAYCLMSNHYHLLVRCPEGGLSTAMHHLGSVYTRHVNDRLGRDGPLFRGRFRSIHVADDGYVLAATRYIHRNPLALPGVGSLADYRWSSYRTYLGHRRCPDFLDVGLVLRYFDGDRRRFAAFTAADEPAFARITDAEGLRSLIELTVASDELASDTAPQWLVRTIAVLLVDQPIAPRLRTALGAQLTGLDAGARRKVVGRARSRLADDPSVARVLRRVVSLIGTDAAA